MMNPLRKLVSESTATIQQLKQGCHIVAAQAAVDGPSLQQSLSPAQSHLCNSSGLSVSTMTPLSKALSSWPPKFSCRNMMHSLSS